jgi:hypothetical protein
VGPRAGLDAVGTRKILPCRESNPGRARRYTDRAIATPINTLYTIQFISYMYSHKIKNLWCIPSPGMPQAILSKVICNRNHYTAEQSTLKMEGHSSYGTRYKTLKREGQLTGTSSPSEINCLWKCIRNIYRRAARITNEVYKIHENVYIIFFLHTIATATDTW